MNWTFFRETENYLESKKKKTYVIFPCHFPTPFNGGVRVAVSPVVMVVMVVVMVMVMMMMGMVMLVIVIVRVSVRRRGAALSARSVLHFSLVNCVIEKMDSSLLDFQQTTF